MTPSDEAQRIDKWLWHTRFVKTRGLAQKLVVAGKVRVGGDKVTTPSRKVRISDILTIALERQVKIVEVTALPDRRGPFSEAQTCYKDLTPPQTRLPKHETLTQPGDKSRRPTKQERRKLLELKHNSMDLSD